MMWSNKENHVLVSQAIFALSRKSRLIKKLFLIGFVAVAAILSAQSAFATSINLGVASDYNAFVFENFTSSNSDAEGRLAVGGDVTLTNYGVGDDLSGVTTLDTLVVGGSLAYTNGQVWNGDVVVGGTAKLTGVNVKDGALTSSSTVSVDFLAAKTYLKSLASYLSTATKTGTAAYTSWHAITLTGDGTSSLQVFYIDGAELSLATSFNISGVPAGATIIINVSGTSVTMQNFSMSALSAYLGDVLFNFYEATSLTLSSISVEGSLLAPLADVTANNGNIDGTIVANSWTGTMELHNVPFEGTTTSVPEPGTAMLLICSLIGLAGLKRRLKM